MDISETTADYGVKVCMYCKLNEYMKIYLYSFYAEATWQTEHKSHTELSWDEKTQICQNSLGHMTKMAAMPIYVKIFFGTKWQISLKLGTQHWALKYHQVCSNDDSWLTFF